MKKLLYILLLLGFKTFNSSLAQQETPSRLLQAYFDDDYINFYGNGTDKAYTNGTRYTLFYTKKKPSQFLIDRLLPKAGSNSRNVFGIGLAQMIFTPNNISNPNFQPNDYPWSGTLYLTHSLYSYNEEQKYDFQTELNLGVSGPAALARQVQQTAHRIVRYQQPEGWSNQFGNSLIINLNFTAEKQLLHSGKSLEMIGGGQAQVGTEINAMSAYSMIRIGKMNPYFQGLMTQFNRSETGSKIQFYFVFKFRVQWMLSNAILQGGINASRPAPILVPGKNGATPNLEYYHPINNLIASYAYGPVFVINRFSVSSIQTTTTPWMKDLYGHTWGNFTFTYKF
ncbi:lipid A deacylase LpxR family protein [Pedobacter hiemivivus]|uniref:Lipid A deacylase LpxR family protein n=1 Tax=Pedobacter hiemivivus TaxID=2530454 RepID=A0A4R0NHX4_9SPHI|nr:lipid A deacylase LpxR family protein [Pedobacter hiemivivus]TCC98394.1 lipid A deacylase LpxR family protein [Pedobacter hiemivivus]